MALGIGALVAILTYPYIRDQLVIRELGDENPNVRINAIFRARNLARASEATVSRLNDALDTNNDVQFAAIASVLKAIEKFYVPSRPMIQIDRSNMIDLDTPLRGIDAEEAAQSRWRILAELTLNDRDNIYIHRALKIASGDKAPAVRELATILAGRLGADAVMKKLLADDNPLVSAAAAFSIAAAKRTALTGQLEKLFKNSKDMEVISAAIYALAVIQPKKASPRICELLKATENPILRDRLLHVMTILKDTHARETVLGILTDARTAEKYPSAMAILVAGKLKISAAEKDIRDTLSGKRSKGKLTEAHLLAAIEGADRLDLPVYKEVDILCRKLWGEDYTLMLISAARLLGKQVSAHASDADRKAIINTLMKAAWYQSETTTKPAVKRKIITTPLPSAAASVALWLLDAPESESCLIQTACETTILPGDYVAWHVAMNGDANKAFALGLKMLPALDAPLRLHVYNDNERSAGAMLLALCARTTQQKRQAVKRIASRLEGGKFGGEDDFCTAGAFRCALLILGQKNQLDLVRHLRSIDNFPDRRVLTALLVTADRPTLDWMLFNTFISAKDIDFWITSLGLGQVLRKLAPSLPPVDTAAFTELRLWQVRIVRHYWGVRRNRIKLGLKR